MSEVSRSDSTRGGGRVAGGPEDKRLLRGARSRQLVLRQAVDTASLDGLEGLSFGRLATDTGLSKAGVQTLFKTKEALQLAALDFARDMFIDAVIQPARKQPHGVQRLRALIELWIVYAQTPLFAGGCYRVANMAEFDSRPGPVRDALVRDQQDWMATIARELRHAVDAGEIADLDIDLAAFQIDAVLCAANTALRLGDADAVPKVRRVVESFLIPTT
ncbi:TetR/AcrR family transcriptional regulator [Nocardia sp. NPDC052112]|uniref:TetR/AcrR family transcriptional regulator n=1 Tax=Nocardia sp. NPDC052112 TaxID=3155646 RepID=UPI003415C0CF